MKAVKNKGIVILGPLRRAKNLVLFDLSNTPSIFDNHNGFTLMELLTVMVIMLMLVAIAVPSFLGIGQGMNARSTVSNVHSSLVLARQWAVTHQELTTFAYLDRVNNNGSNACYFITNNIGQYIQMTNNIDRYIDFGGSGSITFKTDGGLVAGSGTRTITINDIKGDAPVPIKTITIYGATGGMKIE